VDIIAGTRHTERVKYVLAADLGQSSDPTAIAVLQHTHAFREWARGGADQFEDTFDVRHLQRLPLGLSYPAVVQEVALLLARPPLVGNCELVIDDTGVGRAVGDIFGTAGMSPTRVTITSGLDQTHVGGSWHVPKQVLISTLDARLHTGELRFAKELTEAGAMAEELKDFRRKVSVAGRYTFEARVGKHDDLVLAVAIGLWLCVGRPVMGPPQFGVYGHFPPNQFGTYAVSGGASAVPGQPDSCAFPPTAEGFRSMVAAISEK
jgi:hypothetical protein